MPGEDLIFDAIENLVGKLCQRQCLSGVSKQVGNAFNAAGKGHMPQKVMKVVTDSVSNASWAGLSSAIPGVGAGINEVAFAGITWKMYYDINDVLGISFSENFMKSIASGVCANIASAAVNAGISCIPVIGTFISAVGGIFTNRTALYSAAYVYINALTAMAESGDFSENSLEEHLGCSVGLDYMQHTTPNFDYTSKPSGTSSGTSSDDISVLIAKEAELRKKGLDSEADAVYREIYKKQKASNTSRPNASYTSLSDLSKKIEELKKKQATLRKNGYDSEADAICRELSKLGCTAQNNTDKINELKAKESELRRKGYDSEADAICREISKLK